MRSSAENLKCLQSELRAANMTWNYYAYGHTVHAFTLMENPIWNGDKSMVSCHAYKPWCHVLLGQENYSQSLLVSHEVNSARRPSLPVTHLCSDQLSAASAFDCTCSASRRSHELY